MVSHVKCVNIWKLGVLSVFVTLSTPVSQQMLCFLKQIFKKKCFLGYIS